MGKKDVHGRDNHGGGRQHLSREPALQWLPTKIEPPQKKSIPCYNWGEKQEDLQEVSPMWQRREASKETHQSGAQKCNPRRQVGQTRSIRRFVPLKRKMGKKLGFCNWLAGKKSFFHGHSPFKSNSQGSQSASH